MTTRRNEDARAVEMVQGVTRRTLVAGGRTSLHEISLAAESVVPLHTHEHEQTGYVVSGHVRFHIGGVEHELSAGDGYTIPGGVEHGVDALEASVCIDVFSPVRDEYLDE